MYNDAHDNLVFCWEALVSAYYDTDITLAQLNNWSVYMGRPVTIMYEATPTNFTLDFARLINDQMIYDTGFYYDMQTAWTAAANAQYLATLADLNAFLTP